MKTILKLTTHRWAIAAYLYAAIYTFGGLTAHKAANVAIAAINHGVSAAHRSIDAALAATRTAFRLDAPTADPAAPRALPIGQPTESPNGVPVTLRPSAGAVQIPGTSASINTSSGHSGLSGKMLEKAGGARIQRLIDDILVGVHRVESSGKLVCLGDKKLEHKAYGPLQIRKPVCEDLVAFYGVKLTPEECQGNWQKSEHAFRLYVGYWLRDYEHEGGQATAEVACRIWNGGPTGFKKSSTEDYWKKVKAADPGVRNLVAAN
ncbi:MAG TPA: hypothetical protein VJJ47_00005 [Candidatus Paceibacterota bacterium]